MVNGKQAAAIGIPYLTSHVLNPQSAMRNPQSLTLCSGLLLSSFFAAMVNVT